METTAQEQVPQPCPCQQQLVGALPWLAVALLVIVVFDRLGQRWKKKSSKTSPTEKGG